MRSIFRFYRSLFTRYDQFALSGAYRVVRKQPNGSYTTAGWKAQIIGNTYVQAVLIGTMYIGYRIGKDVADRKTIELVREAYFNGVDDTKNPRGFIQRDSVHSDLHP